MNSRFSNLKDDKHANIITSYGIACVRKNHTSNKYEVLMIKKRTSYAFVEFIRGQYDPSKDVDLQYMFSKMTITEKSLIQTQNFNLIWSFAYNEPTNSNQRMAFNRSQRKFNQLINKPNLLNTLITNTTNATLHWEIPKGRLNKEESPIDAAIREFQEETGVTREEYRLIPHEHTVDQINSIEYTFSDWGTKYKYIFYIAIIASKIEPKYDFLNKNMVHELSELKFMSSAAVQELNDNRLAKCIRVIIKKAKKHI